MHELQVKFKSEIDELVEACIRTAQLGFVTSHGGNLSYRVDEDVILITPTKVVKRKITFNDITIIDLDGRVLFANEGRKPTGETPFHIRIFKKRPDLKALVHAHPPILTGFALNSNELLKNPYLPEPVLELGPIVNVAYAEPLSEELACAFDEVIEDSNAFLMKNHGTMMCSTEGIERALDLLEMTEAAAKSILVAQVLGGAETLCKKDVQNLDKTLKTRNLPMPGIPGKVQSLVDLFFK